MAFATKRRGSKRYTVYYYDRREGRQRQLPRNETPSEIHSMSQAEADRWVQEWEAKAGLKVHRAMRYRLREGDELRLLWTSFQDWWRVMRNVSDGQIKERDNDFEKFVAPYFVGELGLKSVKRWHEHMLGYVVWLSSSTGLKDMVAIKSCLWMVRRFGEFLVQKQVLQYPWVLILPTRNAKKRTPLKVSLLPHTVLAAARALQPTDALALLLGYFGSLGPAEVYGLDKADFMTGDLARRAARTHEGLAGHVFADHNLGSGLSVSIERQITGKGIEKFPKNDYRCAVVNIWHPEAAQAIAALLKECSDGRLFLQSRSTLERHHRERIKSVLRATAHDLRRSSAVYLGRRVRIPLELLQRHLRHSQIETTELYIREPEVPDEKISSTQNFDDVG